MITFQAEKLMDVREEVWPLLLRHWDEIALNKDAVPLNPDWDTYGVLETQGMLHVTTARSDAGEIVGYASYVIVPNLHYKTMMVADGDIFYLAPEHRRGTTGLRLLRETEKHILAFCAASGKPHDCVYIINKEKEHFRKEGRSVVGPIMTHLGFKLIEHYYAKRIPV